MTWFRKLFGSASENKMPLSARLQPRLPNGTVVGSYEALTVSAYCEGMQLGDKKNSLLCPYCHGGATGERTFSVAAYYSGVQWRCWRASCGKKGRINLSSGLFSEGADTAGLDAVEESTRAQNMMKRNMEFQPMWEVWKKKLKEKFGILPEMAISKGWQSNVDGGLCIPLRDPRHGQAPLGWEFRKMEGYPKSIMNLSSTKTFPRNCFDTKGDQKTVLIVEDSISALKASIVCRTYSIQGTNLTQAHVEELGFEWPADRYLLALDRDATEKASNLVKKYAFLLPKLRLCPITKDLKYYYVSEIQSLVESYK